MVNAYACVDQNRLHYIQTYQRELRCNFYFRLQDALDESDHDASVVERRLVLPTSFLGGPRSIIQFYQDTMALII